MKTQLLIFVLLISCVSNAQKFCEQIYRPDSVSESAVYDCLMTLNLFTDGAPDSLFVHLGNDTNIVHPDTLRKYSALHLKEYDYDNGATKNPRKWIVSPTSFYSKRTYVGIGQREGDSITFNGALVVTTEMSYRNGKVIITKIRFRITDVTKEVYDTLIVKREKNKTEMKGIDPGDLDPKDYERNTPAPPIYNPPYGSPGHRPRQIQIN